MINRAYFFPLSMFIYGWEENDHVSSTVFFPIGCRSRKSLFICEFCRVAGHAPSSRQRSLSLAVARVAGNQQLSIEMNGIVSLCRWVSLVVWTGLHSAGAVSPERLRERWWRHNCFTIDQTHHMTTMTCVSNIFSSNTAQKSVIRTVKAFLM